MDLNVVQKNAQKMKIILPKSKRSRWIELGRDEFNSLNMYHILRKFNQYLIITYVACFVTPLFVLHDTVVFLDSNPRVTGIHISLNYQMIIILGIKIQI